jgi:hypothetical protein
MNSLPIRRVIFSLTCPDGDSNTRDIMAAARSASEGIKAIVMQEWQRDKCDFI